MKMVPLLIVLLVIGGVARVSFLSQSNASDGVAVPPAETSPVCDCGQCEAGCECCIGADCTCCDCVCGLCNGPARSESCCDKPAACDATCPECPGTESCACEDYDGREWRATSS